MSHGCSDQVNGGLKPQVRQEDLISKTSNPAGARDQVSSSPELRCKWPEEDLGSTADGGDGFYPFRLGETLDAGGRFVITRKLGWGGFSSVWLARDCKEDRHVALKVLSSYASKEVEAGRMGERDILRKIANAAPLHPGFQRVVHLLHEFTFESYIGRHICFVTNVLCDSVPSLQKELGEKLFSLKFTLRIVKHVLEGLEYLHDECGVVHSDLKPANILIMTPQVDEVVKHELSEQPSTIYDIPAGIHPKKIPVIPVMSAPLCFAAARGIEPRVFHWAIADFGHSHLQQKHLSDVVQPYALRAPEVILGLGWGPPIDIWSLGCMMYEFATGDWLFSPEDKDDIPRDIDHLAQMTRRTGQDHSDAALERFEIQKKQNNPKDLLRRATTEGASLGSIESELNKLHGNGVEVSTFIRIMLSFLEFDPSKRPRAVEALLDPAFEEV